MKIFIKEISKHQKNKRKYETNKQTKQRSEGKYEKTLFRKIGDPPFPPLPPLLTKKAAYLRPKTGFQRHILEVKES